MSFKFKPKPTVDREATEDELKRIKESEEMLKEEKKLPPTSQMVRDIATTHWKSLKAFMRGKHVIVPQEVAEERWEICKSCPELLYDEETFFSSFYVDLFHYQLELLPYILLQVASFGIQNHQEFVPSYIIDIFYCYNIRCLMIFYLKLYS